MKTINRLDHTTLTELSAFEKERVVDVFVRHFAIYIIIHSSHSSWTVVFFFRCAFDGVVTHSIAKRNVSRYREYRIAASPTLRSDNHCCRKTEFIDERRFFFFLLLLLKNVNQERRPSHHTLYIVLTPPTPYLCEVYVYGTLYVTAI